jgi:hypothetical protein
MDELEIVVCGLLVKPIFRGSRKKWLSGIGRDKMVKRGRLSIHLNYASTLSKEWGEGQIDVKSGRGRIDLTQLNKLTLNILYVKKGGNYQMKGTAGRGERHD